VEVWLSGEKATEGNDLMYQVQVMQMLGHDQPVMGYQTEFVMKVLEEVVEVASSGDRVSSYAAVVQVPKRSRTLREVVDRLGDEREREYSGKKDGYEEWL
jgi:hypothetical protein